MRILSTFFLVIISSWLTERFLSFQTFSLFEMMDHLLVSKRLMVMGVTGSDSFLLTRSPLAGGELNLGAFHGFQEIQSREDHELIELAIDARIPLGSEVLFYWGKTNEGFQGLKFSLDRRVHLVLADQDGKYVQKELIPADYTDEKLDIRIHFDQRSLQINNTPMDIPLKKLKGTWGMKGGLKPVYIDHLQSKNSNGSIYVQNFSPDFDWPVFLIFLAVYGMIVVVCYFNPNTRNKILPATYFLTILICFIYAFDYFYWSRLPLDEYSTVFYSVKKESIAGKLESWRISLFDRSLTMEQKKAHLGQYYPLKRIYRGPVICLEDKGCHYPGMKVTKVEPFLARYEGTKLLWVGTSQTIGSGSSSLQATFAARLHRELLKQKKKLLTLNIAISSVDADYMFEEFKDAIEVYRPQVSIINLGLNGSDTDLVAVMKKFIQLAKERKIHLILVREAIHTHKGYVYAPYLDLIENLAWNEKVPYIDLHGEMKALQEQEMGELWWDIAHFTDLGQKAASSIILNYFLATPLP